MEKQSTLIAAIAAQFLARLTWSGAEARLSPTSSHRSDKCSTGGRWYPPSAHYRREWNDPVNYPQIFTVKQSSVRLFRTKIADFPLTPHLLIFFQKRSHLPVELCTTYWAKIELSITWNADDLFVQIRMVVYFFHGIFWLNSVSLKIRSDIYT